MATRADDLRVIRRLSQYRPFERGGQSARERKEDLVLAGLAEAGGACTSIGDCAATLHTLWGLRFDELELADPVAHLIADRRVVRDTSGRLSLSEAEHRRLDAAAQQSQTAADRALREWHTEVVARWPAISQEDLSLLDQVLEKFLYAVVQQHGAEAALLIYPEEPGARAIVESEDAKAQALANIQSREDVARAEWALSIFMRAATDAQRAYLSETLNTAYFVTTLTLDPDGARLVQDIASGQRVYLDTNFVYRLLGVQGPRYVRAAETILRATQAAGYVCAVTPWTVEEYRGSLARSKQFLERYPIPPDQFATLAADVTSVEDFVTSYWRQVKTTNLSVTDYVAFHTEVESHLQERGIAITAEGTKAIDAQRDRIAAETTILVRVLAGKWRHPELVEHDVKHRLLVERLRGDGNRSFANAGYWFLTHDRVLPRYDMRCAREMPNGKTHLPFCVSAGAWFQIVEAFRPKTEDFSQTLADVISSPYIHPRSSISRELAQSVVARVSLYRGGTPELAARVFMNSAAMAEIEGASADDQVEVIDNAIVAAAKDAQEEARLAREEADRERQNALAVSEAAQARIAQTQKESGEALEAARRQAELKSQDMADRAKEAARNEAARRDAAARAATERHESTLAQERKEHREALEAKDRELRDSQAKAARFRRRVRLAGVALVVFVAFVVVGLVAGLSRAWEYVAGAGVVLGLLAAADQLWKPRE